MPTYAFRCAEGHRFERLCRTVDEAPDCPECGAAATRRPSAPALLGRADPGPGPDQAPTTWRATGGGDRETVLHWRRTLEQRARLEDKHPELRTPRQPVRAHEGPHAWHSHPHAPG